MEELEAHLGYQFQDRNLLKQALTHPSLTAEKSGEGADNQRLEFLGDAVVQLVLTDYFYRKLPHEAEGRLTQLRASVVSRKALAVCAVRIELGKFLRLGRGEDANGGRERESNLADAVEAVIGAIYLDGGIEVVRESILRIFEEDLVSVKKSQDMSNPKGRLQEILQAIDQSSPMYRVVEEAGPDHSKEFLTEVVWRGSVLGAGKGSSKKVAEAAAAEDALKTRCWEKE